MKEETGWDSFCRQCWFQTNLYVALSFVEYVIIEAFLDGDIVSIGLEYSIKNIMLLMGVNLIIVSLTRWLRFTFLLSGVFVLILGMANYFVDAFRGYGIVYMDIYAVKTAANVAGEYKYHGSPQLWLGLVLGLAFIVLCVVITPSRSHGKSIRQGIASVVGAAAGVVFFVWINLGQGFFGDVTNLTWDHSIGMSDYGYLLYVTANAGNAKVEKPDGYSPVKADEILSRYQKASTTNSVLASHAGSAKSPNLIMIMNESFSDLSVLGRFETDQAYLPFFNSLKKNTIRGYADSSVYGGYTANSEFEFLTGCTKAFLPGNPYLQYIKDYLPNVVSNIKTQEGYDKAVAIHPYNPSGYNRNRVYPLLHMDEFLNIDDFKNPLLVRKYISDASDYEMLESLYENKKEGSALCLFNVTMQNHSSYDDTDYTFENPVKLTSMTLQPEAEQYLSLIKMSDNALKELITYFEKVKQPVIIVLFGDHQPHLPDYFYKNVMGEMPDDLSQKDAMKRYQVPFMIWANYDIQAAEIPQISINYLSTLMTETAGLKLTDYQKFLLDMYQYIPSITANGFYDRQGNLYSWDDLDEADAELQEWIKEYRILQYNYLFDEEHRKDAHYQLKEKMIWGKKET